MSDPTTPPEGTISYPAYAALSPRRRAFVDAYLETGNASEAARRAGYRRRPGAQGPRLVANGAIQAALEERARPTEDRRIAGAQEVLEQLTTIARDTSLEARDRIRALELLGKRYGLWVERLEVESKGQACGVLILPPKVSADDWEEMWGRKPKPKPPKLS